MLSSEKINYLKSELAQESKVLGHEAKERTLGYITAALGLIAGLAWNDAIKAIIDYWIPLGGGVVWAKLGYAVIVTIIVVVATVYLARFLDKK